MDDILALLYNGEINPAEQMVSHDKKYHLYLHRETDLNERLETSFNSAQQELFQKYKSSTQQTEAYLSEKAFRVGFQMGLQFAIAAKG